MTYQIPKHVVKPESLQQGRVVESKEQNKDSRSRAMGIMGTGQNARAAVNSGGDKMDSLRYEQTVWDFS